MAKKTPDTEPLADSTLNPQSSLLVAYHDGPNAIGFCGRRWQRDVAQSVTADEWGAMQARGDFNEFDFKQEQ